MVDQRYTISEEEERKRKERDEQEQAERWAEYYAGTCPDCGEEYVSCSC